MSTFLWSGMISSGCSRWGTVRFIESWSSRTTRTRSSSSIPAGCVTAVKAASLAAEIEVGDAGFALLKPSAAAPPNDVILDHPSGLRNDDQQVDYIMIAHRALLDQTRAAC